MDTISREPTPPGVILAEEFLKPMNISRAMLGKKLGITRVRTGEIINGRRRISFDEAVKLAALFETGADFWINIQAAHDRWLARQVIASSKDLPAWDTNPLAN